MKKIHLILSLLIFSFAFSQQRQDTGTFSSLEVYDKIAVNLIPSGENYVEIMGSNTEDVQIINKNRTLKIRMNMSKFLGGDKVSVNVHYTTLNQINASEGSSVTSDQKIENPSLTLNAKEGASIVLETESNMVDVKTNSGGYIKLSGTSNAQSVVSNAGGNYEGKGLKTKTATVTVNAGGEAEVFASNFVNATTRAGGNIYIYGNPKVEQKSLAGGKVHIK